jgi:putative PIN family toxin of toxin-antitoxin system
MRVVLDTNVLVSRLLSTSGAPASIIDRWRQGAFEVLASTSMLAEYRRVLAYPKIQARLRLTNARLDQLIEDFHQVVVLVEPSEVIEAISSDPADNKFIECAVAGSAEYIVSGDRHLLGLQQFRGIRILTPAAFLTILTADAS